MAATSGAVDLVVEVEVSASNNGEEVQIEEPLLAATRDDGEDRDASPGGELADVQLEIEVVQPTLDYRSPDPPAITSESVKISMLSVNSYKAGDAAQIYLPGVAIIGQVSSNLQGNRRRRRPQFVVSMEHGPFTWSVYKHYTDFVSLRRVLTPLKIRRRRRKRYLPHLLSMKDLQPLQVAQRTQRQLPKVRRFINAVLTDREFRSKEHTLKFFEIGRLSFVEDLGSKRKEGLVSKRSGGQSQVTNCLGCHACCVCRFSVWRIRWFVLKDSYLVYVRSDKNTIAGVLLFDAGTMITTGPAHTGLVNGLLVGTLTRNLLVKCTSRKSMKEWKDALQEVMDTTGKQWVSEKRFSSFAPARTDWPAQWIVDGKDYFGQVAEALLAAKEEIYITDWILSPQMYLKRSEDNIHNLNYRLDKLIYKKAQEGVKVYIQLYKDLPVALDLGSEYVKDEFKHRNIVVFRHPEHIASGVYKWGHHEKIVVVDQTLAFVGGFDLSFGRYDNCSHDIFDSGHTVTFQDREGEQQGKEQVVYMWPGNDYYNPYVKDFVDHTQPHEDLYVREEVPRMPWHDIASCVFGAPARDVARHFIQRYNYTRHEQSLLTESPLLPRQEFSGLEKDLVDYKYLRDVLQLQPHVQVDIQILRSVSEWSAGTPQEHSILNAYVEIISKAEHFIYIENQFFISSLKEVQNSIAEQLRQRIARAHREKKTFRVIIVMPLLPSFSSDFEDAGSATLKIVLSWTYKSFSRGEDSLFSKLTQIDGVPEGELSNYISVYGLRSYSGTHGNLVSEILYVHSKCMVVDDRATIIGSANINDRSMLGDRDSEVAIYVQDREMIDGKMNGQEYPVGKFSHSLRCHLFKEFLGLLEGRSEENHTSSSVIPIDIEDPVTEEFYSAWSNIAQRNMEIFETVFGGEIVPSDSVHNYNDLRAYKEKLGMKASDAEGAKKLLEEVQGFLVPMPLKFLEQEDLQKQLGNLVVPQVFV